MKDEIIELTKKLVSIASINSTEGEKNIGCFIEEYVRGIPYFQKHPEQVYIAPLRDDILGRRNVLALLKGEKDKNNKTLILHGHTDTVGVEDYGFLKDYAFDCDALQEKLKYISLPAEVKEDLESGNYLFGRGACDMKSGDAVFLALLKNLAQHPWELSGNILLSLNPVEENLHTGIIESLDVFEKLREAEGLEYVMAINNDYICPLYPGDRTRTVYLGAVGKLLPCFYVMGKETHVGQCFEGLDATMIASEIVRIMNLNTRYCDGYNDEFTLPPSVLKMKDLKDFYNVQTAYSAFLYFNYFVHIKSMSEIIDLLVQAGREAFCGTLELVNERYLEYCGLTGIEYRKINYETQVLTYEQLYKMALEAYGGQIDSFIKDLASMQLQAGTDKREIPLEIIRKLMEIAGIKIPTIVIFFAAPYCPHNTLKKEVPEEEELLSSLKKIISSFEKESNESFKIAQFFPSLSDSSYIKMDDNSLTCLTDNFPAYEELYPLPFEQIRRLNIPAVNYGCFGKDAHKWTERVYIPYSFEVLPRLLLKTIDEILKI